MSAGRFVSTFYLSDSVDVHACRIQPETASLTIEGEGNAAPDGPPTSVFWVRMNQGARTWGLRPRAVMLEWQSDPPDGYKPGTRFEVNCLNPVIFNVATIGATGTYLGTTVNVVGKRAERVFPEI